MPHAGQSRKWTRDWRGARPAASRIGRHALDSLPEQITDTPKQQRLRLFTGEEHAQEGQGFAKVALGEGARRLADLVLFTEGHDQVKISTLQSLGVGLSSQ